MYARVNLLSTYVTVKIKFKKGCPLRGSKYLIGKPII